MIRKIIEGGARAGPVRLARGGTDDFEYQIAVRASAIAEQRDGLAGTRGKSRPGFYVPFGTQWYGLPSCARLGPRRPGQTLTFSSCGPLAERKPLGSCVVSSVAVVQPLAKRALAPTIGPHAATVWRVDTIVRES